jgi:hypothetical protein
MGRNDEALVLLQQACANHSPWLTSVKVDPLFDPLRGDPRFQQILECVKLAS